MNILYEAFRLLPKSVQVTMLIEDLKRVEGNLEYNRALVRVLEDRSDEIRSQLHELGIKR